MFHAYGAMGLAVASDLGIALQTLTIAFLLHQRRMVSLASLDYPELGRCLLAAIVSGTIVWTIFSWIPDLFMHVSRAHSPTRSRGADLAVLLAGTAIWLAITDRLLIKTGSALPKVTKQRLGFR
jgi:putative peptidoglycan lipid II flippase